MHHQQEIILSSPHNPSQNIRAPESPATVISMRISAAKFLESESKHVSRTCCFSSPLSANSRRNLRRKTWSGANSKETSSASASTSTSTYTSTSASASCCARNWGCSTMLKLYDNPWKIKKALTRSDLGKLNRLLFGVNLLEKLMLPVLGAAAQREARRGNGTPVRVWDVDTVSMHQLILKRWASFKNYVLIGKWNQDFVKRRELKQGDEIGLHWDSYRDCFNFSVLKRTEMSSNQ